MLMVNGKVMLMKMKALVLMVTQILPDPVFGKRAAQRENKRRKGGGGGGGGGV